MGRTEIAQIKAGIIKGAREDTAKRVIGTLPTPRPADPSPSRTLGKNDSEPVSNVPNKAAYWKEYYDLPEEARSYVQPGTKKAYLDIMDKALKSAGL